MSHNQLADIPVDTFTVVCVVLCCVQDNEPQPAG